MYISLSTSWLTSKSFCDRMSLYVNVCEHVCGMQLSLNWVAVGSFA